MRLGNYGRNELIRTGWLGLLSLAVIACANGTNSAHLATVSVRSGGGDSTCVLDAARYCQAQRVPGRRFSYAMSSSKDGVYEPTLDSRGDLMAAVECYGGYGYVIYAKTLTEPQTPAAIKFFRELGLCTN